MAEPKPAKPRLHFRVDDSLNALVRDYAEDQGVSVSEACRLILRVTLGDDDALAAVTETIYTFQAMRTRVVSRLAAEMQDRFPAVLDEELAALRDSP